MRIVCAITGASGALYGERLVLRALELGLEIHLVVSAAGRRVAKHELGHAFEVDRGPFAERARAAGGTLRAYSPGDVGAPAASGSSPLDGMVVAPCSMGTAGRIAAGASRTLIERAAEVTLKQRRPLVLVPRETPLNRIHLENLLRLHDAGAIVLPAMPAFYHRPEGVEDLVDHIVDRALSFVLGPEVVRRPWWRPDEADGEADG